MWTGEPAGSECLVRTEPARGFTLIEALIALAIAGLVLAALFDGAAIGLRAVDTAGRSAEALSRARSRLAAIGVGQKLAASVREGDDGTMHWRETIARRAGAEAAPTLFDITVQIGWSEAGRANSVSLRTRRLAGADGRVR